VRHQGIFLWVVASAALMLVGAFGPWVDALGIGVNGTDGSNDGWIVVGAAAVGGGLFLARREDRGAGVWPVLAGLVGAATTIYDRHHISSTISDAGPIAQALAHVGWGLNLAMVASISLAIAGGVWLRTVESEESAV
jgi:hypothetical protein